MKRALAILVVCACGGGHAPKPVAPKPTPVVAPTPAPAPAKGTTGKASELTGAIKSVRIEVALESRRAEVQAAFAGVIGKPLDLDQVRASLVDVMKIAGVANVAASGVQLADGIELVVQVTLHPVMKKISAIETGGKTIALGMAAMQNNTPLDPHRIQTLVASLRERYRSTGHFDVEVTWRRTPAEGGVDVVIEVTPGVPASIGSVELKGNTIASSVLLPKIAKLLVVGEPVLDDKLESAARVISGYYWDVGYANVSVNAPKVAAGKNAIVFRIVEGPKFKIGVVKLTGDVPEADRANFLKLFGVKQGDLFSRTAIADGVKRVVDAIIASGRPMANAFPLTKVDLTNNTIGLTLEINRGPS